MQPPVPDIEVDTVEHAIRDGFRLLRFSPRVEQRFEADGAAERCRHIVRQNYIGLFVYHCFLFSDYRAIGDVFTLDLIMHFLVTTPVTIVANVIISRQPPAWLREGLETACMVNLATTIALVVAMSRMPDRDMVLFCLVLVVLFGIMVQRVRMWYALSACIMIQVLYSIVFATITPFSMDRAIMSNSIFLGIGFFSLLGAYHLEREQRMGYLLRLRDRLRNRELEITSFKDALTGLSNRRALDNSLKALSDGPPVTCAVLLFDIDHFKAFNDMNGHQNGDLCLRRVADLIAESFQGPKGAAYRYGGEEFLGLLVDVSLPDALTVAESIRERVAQALIPRTAKADSFVTISVGVAAGVLRGDVTSEDLVAAADRALYAAKNSGRNVVSSSLDAALPQAATNLARPVPPRLRLTA